MQLKLDDLNGPEIQSLLQYHLDDFAQHSPPESCHALDLDGLRGPDVTFWTVWEDDDLMGCGAIKELDPEHGEIKSMRTAPQHLRKGVARYVLEHIVAEARRRGYKRLSLETGSMAPFKPAQLLYSRFGFTECPPFGSYKVDPNSLFMTKEIWDAD